MTNATERAKVKTSTEVLRALLDERGAEWSYECGTVSFGDGNRWFKAWAYNDNVMCVSMGYLTPGQVIAATLGPLPWVDPTWERWHKSLKHDEVKSIGDAVEQLMYEAIEFGGDLGPNGNTYNGIDEGDVLTSGYIGKWVERFENMLGQGTCRDLAETPAYREKTSFRCSECGYEYSSVGGFGCDFGDEPDFRYCPNCGRRVLV